MVGGFACVFFFFFKLMVLDESLEPEKCVGRC